MSAAFKVIEESWREMDCITRFPKVKNRGGDVLAVVGKQ